MINFSEDKFPTDISYTSLGGPEFKTNIITTNNGNEYRKISWSQARSKYNIAYSMKTSQQLEEIIAFFRSKHGKAIGFRFKDWTDFQANNQNIGIGDGKTNFFQLKKSYETLNEIFLRIIYKPVINSVKIYVNKKEVQNYIVDYTTGKLKFFSPPLKGQIITADFEFDIPVRFDNDTLSISMDNHNLFNCHDINLVEIKL